MRPIGWKGCVRNLAKGARQLTSERRDRSLLSVGACISPRTRDIGGIATVLPAAKTAIQAWLPDTKEISLEVLGRLAGSNKDRETATRGPFLKSVASAHRRLQPTSGLCAMTRLGGDSERRDPNTPQYIPMAGGRYQPPQFPNRRCCEVLYVRFAQFVAARSVCSASR
jgi:hypothetical protein